MTLYHFGNCVALVYAPYHMAYKFSGISEYGNFSRCVQVGGMYFLTQLVKMLLLATFFPDIDPVHATGQYNVFLELLKATVDLSDYLGMYLAINSVPGKGHAKIFTVAIGWAGAEVIAQRSVMLWVGARGAEFSWVYVWGAAAGGVALAQHAAAAALLWLCTRPPRSPLLLLLPAPYVLGAALSAPALVAARTVLALSTGLVALALYARLPSNYA